MPEWATKERREKVLDLLPEECDLIREQRLVRSPNTVVGFEGSLLLFPRSGGTPWRYHSSFWNRVIVPTRTKAARAWRDGARHDRRRADPVRQLQAEGPAARRRDPHA